MTSIIIPRHILQCQIPNNNHHYPLQIRPCPTSNDIHHHPPTNPPLTNIQWHPPSSPDKSAHTQHSVLTAIITRQIHTYLAPNHYWSKTLWHETRNYPYKYSWFLIYMYQVDMIVFECIRKLLYPFHVIRLTVCTQKINPMILWCS